MHRFFVEPEALLNTSPGGSILLTNPELLSQLSRVLRMKPGDRCLLLDNSGWEYACECTFIEPRRAIMHILEKRKNAAEPALFLTLYQAMPKKRELFEWVLQKGTEIGVSRFVPLMSERTERDEIRNIPRLTKILKEAAEQCGRGKIPELSDAVDYATMLRGESAALKILLHEKAEKQLPLIAGDAAHPATAALAIGPEGGFSEKEATIAEDAGWHVASLGPRVLRTETAGIVGAAMLLL